MCGLLLGANIGFLALPEQADLAGQTDAWRRILKVLFAWGMFFGGAWLMQLLGASHPIFQLPGIQALPAMIPSFLLIWGTVTVSKRLESISKHRLSLD